MGGDPEFFAELLKAADTRAAIEEAEGRPSLKDEEAMMLDRLADAERRISGVTRSGDLEEKAKLMVEAELSR